MNVLSIFYISILNCLSNTAPDFLKIGTFVTITGYTLALNDKALSSDN